MKQEGSLALFHYWNRLRNGRTAPKRTEVEPADIKTLLGDTFILERDTRGEAIFRLAGTRLCAVYGRELKGFAFSSLWREHDRRMMSRLTSSVFNTKSVIVFDFEGFAREDRSAEFEFLLLPLDGGHENPRALGILSTRPKPFWLGADPLSDAKVGTAHFVNPDKDPLFLKNRPPVPLPSVEPVRAPYPIVPDKPFPNAKKIKHLVVLEGGREP